MKREYISEIAWSKIFSFLKTLKNIYCGNEQKIEKFIGAILWITRTGAQWRELPDKYGKWNSVFTGLPKKL